jgi:apolipoprotein N-acyltransferase
MATACLLHRMFSCHTVEQCLKIFVFFVIMVGLLWFPGHPWTKPKGATLSIAMVQGNFQDKWSTPLATQLGRYIDLSPKTTQVVLWPEAALPVSDDSITDTLNDMQHFFQTRQQTLATGLITHQHGQWFNSVRLFGKDQGLINKRHLVPFGEYVPTLLRPFLHWLPGGMGTMHAGSYHQSTLALHGVPISTLICYEVAYPELVRTQSQRTELLVTFNDSHWFGPSFAASQQLEMAVMRSQELQKPMLYVSNTGWTVHINAMGRIVQALANNRPGMLRILAQPHIGQTPYAYYGDHLILGLSMLGLLFIFREKSKKDTKVAR